MKRKTTASHCWINEITHCWPLIFECFTWPRDFAILAQVCKGWNPKRICTRVTSILSVRHCLTLPSWTNLHHLIFSWDAHEHPEFQEALERLVHLRTFQMRMRHKPVRMLNLSRLTECRRLCLFAIDAMPIGWFVLLCPPRLQHLELRGDGMSRTIANTCESIETLSFGEDRTLEDLSMLRYFPNLRRIVIYGCRTFRCWKGVGQLQALETITVQPTEACMRCDDCPFDKIHIVWGSCASIDARLANVRHLVLTDKIVDLNMFKRLHQQLPHLSRLQLRNRTRFQCRASPEFLRLFLHQKTTTEPVSYV